jgi:DeoR family transcriptional regulator, fructose operon transcriptional repressor
MLADARRQGILNLIQESGSARTLELARLFGVSDQTIRRDLLELQEKGLISKRHGGGVLVNWQGASYHERATSRREEKLAIAREAIKLVKRGMTVLMGPGTTTEATANLLDGMEIAIVTNSLEVARAIMSSNTAVKLTGGRYRPGSELVTGSWTSRNLDHLFADLTFIGVSGISAKRGYTVIEADEALVLRRFIRIAKRSIVVADSSKLARVARETVAPLGAVHTLITDAGVTGEQLELLAGRGVDVVVAPKPEALRPRRKERDVAATT